MRCVFPFIKYDVDIVPIIVGLGTRTHLTPTTRLSMSSEPMSQRRVGKNGGKRTKVTVGHGDINEGISMAVNGYEWGGEWAALCLPINEQDHKQVTY